MEVTVRFFASLRDATGTSQYTLELPDGASVSDLIVRLLESFPELDGHQASWHFAVNQTHAGPETQLRAGDRVAIFPYIAGG